MPSIWGGGGGGGTTVTSVVKSADESVTASTTLQDDDELTVAVSASTTYLIQGILFLDGHASGDFKGSLSGPSGATWRVGVFGTGSNTTTFENGTLNNQTTTAAATAPPIGLLGAGNVNMAFLFGYVTVSTTPGNMTLRWAQQASHATATKVLTGSWLSVTPAS